MEVITRLFPVDRYELPYLSLKASRTFWRLLGHVRKLIVFEI